MTTRFCPSLNGSLHLGHLWMAWLNCAWARQEGGRFILRFDDLAPAFAGEDTSHQEAYAAEGEELLCRAGIVADETTMLSRYFEEGYPAQIGGHSQWQRGPSLESWDNVGCSPGLVAARVRADMAEGVTHVIRGEELVPELQLYEFLNHQLGGSRRELYFVPRLRVRINGELTTISKTYGNLQLRDLFRLDKPENWVERVREVGLKDVDKPISLDNLQPDPIISL